MRKFYNQSFYKLAAFEMAREISNRDVIKCLALHTVSESEIEEVKALVKAKDLNWFDLKDNKGNTAYDIAKKLTVDRIRLMAVLYEAK